MTHIACPHTTVCYAVGYLKNDFRAHLSVEYQSQLGAVIVETTNAAQSWRTRSSRGNVLAAVACPTVRDCYAEGYRGDTDSHGVISLSISRSLEMQHGRFPT